MKIRIVEPGWANLTGNFGSVEFKDGVSVEDVAPAEAARLANLVRVENVEDQSNPSMSQAVLDSATISMDVGLVRDAASGKVVDEDKVSEEQPAEPVVVHTQESLFAIADAKGINGLREVADPMGIKGNSISGLIAAILEAQAPKQVVESVKDAPASE